MKKKLFLGMVMVALLMVVGYQYLYRPHRDIKSEESDYLLTVPVLAAEFNGNPEMANARYADKVVEVRGIVTAIDAEAGSVTLDRKLYATLSNNIQLPRPNQKITVKGRFLGYDDLLEELRMDQATIAK